MKIRTGLLLLMLVSTAGVQADWKSFLKEQLGGGDSETSAGKTGIAGLSTQEVIAGLKQALQKGAKFAVDSLGRQDGFWGNPQVRIPMPEKLETVEKTLRQLGQDKYADEFELTMNRAAEAAVPLTLDILKKGVREMTIDDAKGILKGPDDAATKYLRKVGEPSMRTQIAPIISDATNRTGVTRQYKQLFEKLGFLGSVMDPEDYDIDRYITDKTLDGLFVMIAKEEKQIRENPVERTTDLLKKVFGAL